MCPACLSTTALLLAGAGSGGVSALLAHRRWRARKEEPMTTPVKTLPSPTFANGRPLFVAGLREDYTFARRQQIPEQWRRFGERWFGRVPGGVGRRGRRERTRWSGDENNDGGREGRRHDKRDQ